MTTFHIENHVANAQPVNNTDAGGGYTILKNANGFAVYHKIMREPIGTYNELEFAKEAVAAFKRTA